MSMHVCLCVMCVCLDEISISISFLPSWQLANQVTSRLKENFENPLHFDPGHFDPSKSRLLL